MSAASLNNMTVRLPGAVGNDNSQPNQGLLMPKLQYRFRVEFLNIGVGGPSSGLALTKQIMDCTRPQVSFDEITLNVYNSRLYLAGKHAWNELTITVRDDASGSVSKAVGQQLQKQLDFVEQASAAAGQDYKFQTNIEILDGGNGTTNVQVLERWECYGCFLKVANYQNLNYAESNPVTLQLQIRYDNALQTPLSSGVGAPIGRIVVTPNNSGIVSGVGSEIPNTGG